MGVCVYENGNGPGDSGDGKDNGNDHYVPRRQVAEIAAAARDIGRDGGDTFTLPKVLVGVSMLQPTLIESW